MIENDSHLIMPHPSPRFVDRNRRRGFSLVELLVVIATLALFIALVIHAATAVRGSASRTSEMASARSLMTAWLSYATDHRGVLLPGYAEGLRARDPAGEWLEVSTEEVAIRRWPLRLAPYLGHDFAALLSGEAREALDGLADDPTSDRLYAVSVAPSFGLNSVFVGGDDNYGGQNELFEQTFGPFYATRLSTVRHPDLLNVFVTSRNTSSDSDAIFEGFFRVLPPAWTTPLWSAEHDPESPTSSGFVSPRHQDAGEDRAIVATVDGGVATHAIDDLRDMRRWCDLATQPDWRMEPVGP